MTVTRLPDHHRTRLAPRRARRRPDRSRPRPGAPAPGPSSTEGHRPLLAIIWLALLATTIVALHASAAPLPAPPLTTVTDVSDWLDRLGPVGAGLALVRIVALALAWYLAAVSFLTLAARAVGSHQLARAALRLAPRLARAALRSLLGAGLSVALLGPITTVPSYGAGVRADVTLTLAAAPTAPYPGSTIAARVVRTDGGSPTPGPPATPVVPETSAPPGTILVTPLDPPPPTADPPSAPPASPPSTVPPSATDAPPSPGADPAPVPGVGPTPDTGPAPPPPLGRSLTGGLSPTSAAFAEALAPGAPSGPAPPGRGSSRPATPATVVEGTWVIRPGDHLWHVAESALERGWGRAPTDAEVLPYWRAVIEANRDRLVDPANPDLVLPGQELALPPIAPPPPS